jgi:hypothetical protein
MKTNALESCINNFINGNLTDALQQAKGFSLNKIFIYLNQYLGWTANQSLITAKYLKGKATFQEICNAK